MVCKAEEAFDLDGNKGVAGEEEEERRRGVFGRLATELYLFIYLFLVSHINYASKY